MGGTWTVSFEEASSSGLVKRSGQVGAHWWVREQACTYGQVRLFSANGGKSSYRRDSVALLRHLRCSRTGRSDREAPVLSRPSTWPHRDSWMFERDRQRQTIRRREKKFRSGTAEEKGRGRRRETKRRRCGELEATLGFAWIIESRAEHSGAVEGFASRERCRNNQTRVVPRGWSRSRDTVPATCKRPRFVVTALRRKRTNACTVSGAPRHVTDRRWTTTFFGQCVSNKFGRSREKLVRLFARRTSIDEGYGV